MESSNTCSNLDMRWISPFSKLSATPLTINDIQDFIHLLSRLIQDNKNIYDILNLFFTYSTQNKIDPKDITNYLLGSAYVIYDKESFGLKDKLTNIFNFENKDLVTSVKNLNKLNLNKLPLLRDLNKLLIECLETKPLSEKNIEKLSLILLQPQNLFLFKYNLLDRIEIVTCLLSNRCISDVKSPTEKKKEQITLKEYMLDPSLETQELLDKEVKFNQDFIQPNIIYSLPLPIIENIILDKCPLDKINWINPFSFKSLTYFDDKDLKRFVSMLLYIPEVTYYDIISTLEIGRAHV